MKILLIEDFEDKSSEIINFIREEYHNATVELRTSYNTAQEEIYEHHELYDLILLDMSMTTYDLSADPSGGNPEPIAGQYLLEGMYLRDINTPVIVITMYNVFGRKELSAFDEELKRKYPQNYKSYVFYSSQSSDWKIKLKKQIKEALC